jgi:hypothetical protein
MKSKSLHIFLNKLTKNLTAIFSNSFSVKKSHQLFQKKSCVALLALKYKQSQQYKKLFFSVAGLTLSSIK